MKSEGKTQKSGRTASKNNEAPKKRSTGKNNEGKGIQAKSSKGGSHGNKMEK